MVLQSKITKQHARLARNAWSLEGISPITKATHLKWKKKKTLKIGGWDLKQMCLFFLFIAFLLWFHCFNLNSLEAYKMCLCFHTLKK